MRIPGLPISLYAQTEIHAERQRKVRDFVWQGKVLHPEPKVF